MATFQFGMLGSEDFLIAVVINYVKTDKPKWKQVNWIPYTMESLYTLLILFSGAFSLAGFRIGYIICNIVAR